MNDLLTATLVGLSFGNLWLCVLLTYTLQTTNRNVCLGFLAGRLIAVFILALAVSLLGKLLPIPLAQLQIISGLILLLYSIYICVRYLIIKGQKKNTHHDSNCSHDCSSCIKSQTRDICEVCHSENGDCLAQPDKMNQLMAMSKQDKKGISAAIFGIQLGIFRGSVLCGKLMLLLPLLINASAFHAATIAILFTITSSIYPITGFLLGKLALKLIRFKRLALFISSALLCLISCKYITDGILAL
ncbi:MAG: hypothetical protein J1G30_06185 [Spirochaetales bacterium]|nr:hypothetical protein [Spirochaetales bacterium]